MAWTRIGIFTGTVYPETVDPNDIRECCMAVPDCTNPDNVIKGAWYIQQHTYCAVCNGCDEARKGE